MTIPAPKSGPPRCFISYSHDSEEHKDRVLDLAEYLRENGVDVSIDRYVESKPLRSFPLWMDKEIATSDFVLIVATENYFTRFSNQDRPGIGLGARWEGGIISHTLYEEPGETTKFVPVIFERDDVQFIPMPLRHANRHYVASTEGRTALLRQLHGEPEITPSPIGRNPFRQGGEAGQVADAFDLPHDEDANSESRILELESAMRNADRKSATSIAIEIGDLRAKDELYTGALTAYRRALELVEDPETGRNVALKFQNTFRQMEARFGEHGPIEAVYKWITAVRSNDFDTCWRMIDPKMRLVLAQAWIVANQNRRDVAPFYEDESAADSLSATRSNHSLSKAFRTTQMREFKEAYGEIDPEQWGAAERPRRFGIDLELIILMKNDSEPFMWEPGKKCRSVSFVVRWMLGIWYIASFGEDLLVPGWPPERKPLPWRGVSFRPD